MAKWEWTCRGGKEDPGPIWGLWELLQHRQPGIRIKAANVSGNGAQTPKEGGQDDTELA